MVDQLVVEHPLIEVNCILGEAPLYDPANSTLHFLDIGAKKVFHLDVNTLELNVEQFDDAVTCLALRRDGGLACAASQGFGILEGEGRLKYISKPLPESLLPHTRFNDGACDAHGRFYSGTICCEDPRVPGQLYRYDPVTGECDIVDPGPFTDSNGLGWSPDGNVMYFTDSLVNRIYAYDVSPSGELSNRRVFVDPLEQGLPEKTFPDGLCVDSDGGVWSARWGGSRVSRFDKDGKLDFEVMLPTALNVTACEFGGDNLDKLYVTTAHCGANGGDASRQQHYPNSGHLFVADLSGKYRGTKWRHEFAG